MELVCNTCVCNKCDSYYSCTGDCQRAMIRGHKECTAKKICSIKNALNHNTIVKFRKIINDAIVREWEPMPEVQPPTVKALKEYLNKCPGWSGKVLKPEHTFEDNGHYVSYGCHKQFYIPVKYTEEDFKEN